MRRASRTLLRGQPIRTLTVAVSVGSLVRPDDAADAFVVLGLGTVQVRKGVDLFLSTAASARRLAPQVRFRFVWIGDGYDPVRDAAYSTYLASQIVRSDLTETVTILDPVEDLDPAYDAADVLFMSSRLDPQPNVGVIGDDARHADCVL